MNVVNSRLDAVQFVVHLVRIVIEVVVEFLVVRTVGVNAYDVVKIVANGFRGEIILSHGVGFFS